MERAGNAALLALALSLAACGRGNGVGATNPAGDEVANPPADAISATGTRRVSVAAPNYAAALN
jgi:hypothetical protein